MYARTRVVSHSHISAMFMYYIYIYILHTNKNTLIIEVFSQYNQQVTKQRTEWYFQLLFSYLSEYWRICTSFISHILIKRRTCTAVTYNIIFDDTLETIYNIVIVLFNGVLRILLENRSFKFSMYVPVVRKKIHRC